MFLLSFVYRDAFADLIHLFQVQQWSHCADTTVPGLHLVPT